MRRENEKPSVSIFTDGACSGNPGIGGYAAILRHGTLEKEISGCEYLTTNNRMELTAAIKALESLKRPCRVTLVTDSDYLVKGMTSWIFQWKKNNWRGSQRRPVLNRDLWENLLALSEVHDIRWEWVRGHNGHPENLRCDLMAREAIDECRKKIEV
jgi:ribonuclease HI